MKDSPCENCMETKLDEIFDGTGTFASMVKN